MRAGETGGHQLRSALVRGSWGEARAFLPPAHGNADNGANNCEGWDRHHEGDSSIVNLDKRRVSLGLGAAPVLHYVKFAKGRGRGPGRGPMKTRAPCSPL